jgi:predicted SAM-dependent methyltransferase
MEQRMRLNVGCGRTCPKEWVNLDATLQVIVQQWPALERLRAIAHRTGLIHESQARAYPDNIIYWNVSKGLPFPTGSVDVVYSCHFLEHLPYEVGQTYLSDAFRVLRPGGILRTVVPNLTGRLHKHFINRNNVELVPEKVHPDNVDYIPENLGNVVSRTIGHGMHLWGYAWETLSYEYKKHGFPEPRRGEFRKSEIRDVEEVETQDGLIVEAYKPKA